MTAGREAELMARYCDGDRALAEDILQETLLKLHEARAFYVRGADPLPWMFTIARHTAFDELRRRKRARVRLVDDDGRPPPEPHAGLSGAPELARASDDPAGAEALAALDQLPAAQRQALILTKVEGLSQAEAAARAGTTPGAIKLRAHRAYVALRKLVRRS